MNVLMGLMALRVMAASLAHSRLGPKTTARLVLVILFWSERAEIYGGKQGAAAGSHKPCLPHPATSYPGAAVGAALPASSMQAEEAEAESHLYQKGSEETKHLIVLLRQHLEYLQCGLHPLALINVCGEWGPRLQEPRAGLTRG